LQVNILVTTKKRGGGGRDMGNIGRRNFNVKCIIIDHIPICYLD